MLKQRKILLLRVSFWVGAIVFALAALELLLPQLWAPISGSTTNAASATLNFVLNVEAVLMLGWAGLLVWADRKPLERKGVLLLTVLVFCGSIANNVWTAASGLMPIGSMLVDLISQTVVACLLAFGYFNALKQNITVMENRP